MYELGSFTSLTQNVKHPSVMVRVKQVIWVQISRKSAHNIRITFSLS